MSWWVHLHRFLVALEGDILEGVQVESDASFITRFPVVVGNGAVAVSSGSSAETK
jgi:hypothetical protein